MSTLFIFAARNSSIIVTISADNEEDAKAEISEYFDNYGTEDLRFEESSNEYEDE